MATLVPPSSYGSEPKKERAAIRTVRTDNLRSLLSIRRIYRIPNTQVRKFVG